MQILLIRHGQSEADILDVHEGRADFLLTSEGRKQASLMAQRVLQEFPPEFIWASTLKRARPRRVRISRPSRACAVLHPSEQSILYSYCDRRAWLEYRAFFKQHDALEIR
jgi:bisphosphoglycerate-dependent phosphoglycerate mutase